MKIVVAATDEQWEELNTGRSLSGLQRVDNVLEFAMHQDADAFFNLRDDQTLSGKLSFAGKPFIISSVTQTLRELNAEESILRVNGWPGFLQRPAWEMAGTINEDTRNIFQGLGIKINPVADEPGFIAARIIAMIINEAYFAAMDGVSSKEEIDTAMKLGTNYPHGPFEWAELIGKKNILQLLQKLSLTDNRYQPSALLVQEAGKRNR